MLIQTNKLIGPALNWAVAIALGWADVQITAYEDPDSQDEPFFRPDKVVNGVVVCLSGCRWRPSTNPAQGHPLTEQEKINTLFDVGGPVAVLSAVKPEVAAALREKDYDYAIGARTPYNIQRGPTSLVAAMRCLVSSKLGDFIDVPEPLISKEMQ